MCVSELFVLMTMTTVGSSAGSEYSREGQRIFFFFFIFAHCFVRFTVRIDPDRSFKFGTSSLNTFLYHV